jgi:outer membrane protein OmpA-like peptidoglycan-associated protein
MRSLFVSAAALAFMAAPAAAQKGGSVEFGVFGRQTWYGTSYELQNKAGVGARLGFFIVRNLEIEAQGHWVPTRSTSLTNPSRFDQKVDNFGGRALLEYNIQARPVAFIIGAGYGYNSFSGNAVDGATGETSESGPAGLVGIRFGVGGVVQARVDGTYDYYSSPASALSGADDDGNWGLQAGISLVFPKEKPRDSDGDGVPDKLDQCPATPAGTVVDDKGCPVPLDDDKDGVVNERDQCPNTPAGETVDAVGCSASQKDDDRDRVNNALDKCPNTPAGVPVDASGCPQDDDKDGVTNPADKCPNTPAGATVDGNGCSPDQLDDDGDGVPNSRDKCPSTKAGDKVDAVGCRLLFDESGFKIIGGVTFATGSTRLSTNAKTILRKEAESINTALPYVSPDLILEVQGHTDNTGSLATNNRLSEARAKAVMDYLATQGVPATRMRAQGFGPSEPIADNKTRDGREKNRRVVLKVVGQ